MKESVRNLSALGAQNRTQHIVSAIKYFDDFSPCLLGHKYKYFEYENSGHKFNIAKWMAMLRLLAEKKFLTSGNWKAGRRLTSSLEIKTDAKGGKSISSKCNTFCDTHKKTLGKKHWLSKVLLKTTSWIFFRLRTFPLRETGIGFVFKKWDQGGVFLIVELDKSGMCSVLQIYSIYGSLW